MMPNPQTVIWEDNEYPTIGAAAEAAGCPYSTMRYRHRNGITSLEEAQDRQYHSKAVVWDGIEYKCINDAAKAAGVPYSTMRHWQRHGIVRTEDIPDRKRHKAKKQHRRPQLSGLEIWQERAQNRLRREAAQAAREAARELEEAS